MRSVRPPCSAPLSAPRAMSTNKELLRSDTIRPIDRVEPNFNDRAAVLGTLETVPNETPARDATSSTLGRGLEVGRFVCSGGNDDSFPVGDREMSVAAPSRALRSTRRHL